MTRDPDLDQAIDDLGGAATRLRHLQHLVANMDPVKEYSSIVLRRTELADAEDVFAVRGEKLRMHDDRRVAGRALLTVVEEANRLRRVSRRRPTPEQLSRAVQVATEAAERDRVEAEADYNLALLRRKLATWRSTSTSAALAYMEASR